MMLLWVVAKKESMVTDSVALLMGSPESCERRFGGSTLDLPIDAGGIAWLSASRKFVFKCGLR
jgi:hypothetical protein